MKDWKEITHYAGFDWAKDHHHIVIVDNRGQIVEQFSIDHTTLGWRQWSEHIARYEGSLAVCIETSQGVVIEQLLQSNATVYPVQRAMPNDIGSAKSPAVTNLISMTQGYG